MTTGPDPDPGTDPGTEPGPASAGPGTSPAPPRREPTRATVSVDDEHLDRLDHVLDRLRELGLEVDEVLPNIGIVTGSTADPDALRGVDGVLSVDAQREFRIPPPDEEVQ